MDKWQDKIDALKNDAQTRLTDLGMEMEEIYTLFPGLRPRTPRQRIQRLYHGTHWTQRPENKARVAALVARSLVARRAKMDKV